MLHSFIHIDIGGIALWEQLHGYLLEKRGNVLVKICFPKFTENTIAGPFQVSSYSQC